MDGAVATRCSPVERVQHGQYFALGHRGDGDRLAGLRLDHRLPAALWCAADHGVRRRGFNLHRISITDDQGTTRIAATDCNGVQLLRHLHHHELRDRRSVGIA
ncbi:hypothetical protein D3C71_1763560 [compost metagenome]